MLGMVFGLRLRQSEGLLSSLLAMTGLDLAVPDHTTLNRRARTWKPQARSNDRQHAADVPIHVLVDSTGLEVYGAGQWLEEKHGVKSRRGWRKLHLAVDAGSGEIIAHSLTDQEVGDASQVEPLLDQIDDEIDQFTADRAYDGYPTYDAVLRHSAGKPLRSESPFGTECLPTDARNPFAAQPRREQPNKQALEQAMSRVNLKGTDISVSKEEIRRASNELAPRTERQAANLEETSAALDELTVAVRQTAEGAREAASRVASVSQEARQSDGIVEQAIAAMSGIEQSATEITKIIGVIDKIAFQTNLLALNAGVEAARAGDSGKGFAVVAQEVRELAQRSAAAAKEIKEQIARSTGQVEQGVQMVGKTGEALKRISSQITAADDIVSKIAHSAQEQDSTLRSISSALNQLDTATQQNAAMAEETTASAEVLANDTGDLLDLIRGFRTNSSASELHRIGHQMRRAG